MLDSTELTGRRQPHLAWKRLLDRRVLPAAIDAATLLENAAEAVAVRIRRNPRGSLLLALGLGCGCGLLGRTRGRD